MPYKRKEDKAAQMRRYRARIQHRRNELFAELERAQGLQAKEKVAHKILEELPRGNITLEQSSDNVGIALAIFYNLYKDEPREVQIAAIKYLKERLDATFEKE